MVDASVIVSVVIAVISLLSSIAVALIGHVTTQREGEARGRLEEKLQGEASRLHHLSESKLNQQRNELDTKLNVQRQELDSELDKQRSKLDEEVEKRREQRVDDKEIAALTAKYSPPLMLAAYELQARLYELIEFPISKEHLETVEGLEDIKIFTCYRFAQFLAWTYILEMKTQYFSFTTQSDLMKIADMILRLNEEFDRRRNADGENIGVWPGSRLLVSARMLRTVEESDVPLDMIVKNYNTFRSEWDENFKAPMSYFCQWIDDMVEGRIQKQDHWDDALRCTQHNLVAMVRLLDKRQALVHSMQPVAVQAQFCDCGVCTWPPENPPPLEYRKQSRDDNVGLVPWYKSEKLIDGAYKESIGMEKFRSYTERRFYNQALYTQYKRG